MRTGRLILIAFVVLVVTLGLGYAWGASGRASAERALQEVRAQAELSEARGRILEARVSLYNVNFGDAQRQLEEARAPLARVRARYQDEGKRDAAESIAAAIAHVQEAQRLASKLDPSANTQAGQALDAIKTATSR